jgi:translation elongation factor EF-Tu-like GTPase
VTSEPAFGATIDITFRLLSTQEGGRRGYVADGYRPLCLVRTEVGDERLIGMCQLDLTRHVEPGESGAGRLRFDVSVSPLVRALLKVGTEFSLAEGRHVVASARVVEVS